MPRSCTDRSRIVAAVHTRILVILTVSLPSFVSFLRSIPESSVHRSLVFSVLFRYHIQLGSNSPVFNASNLYRNTTRYSVKVRDFMCPSDLSYNTCFLLKKRMYYLFFHTSVHLAMFLAFTQRSALPCVAQKQHGLKWLA